MPRSAEEMERFAGRIARRGPDECWPWSGTRTVQGYGQITFGHGSPNEVRAHRLALALAVGPIPDGLEVQHSCDNRLCCNPAHLRTGTKAENQHDKGRRGRAAKGERNGGGGKLRDAEVRQIRAALARGESKQSIGARFGVSGTEIGYIARGKHWAHV